MTALMPRLVGDLTDWFESDFPLRPGHMIRVEEEISENEYRVRAELPGMDPDRDIRVMVDDNTLTVHAERRQQEQVRGRTEFRYGMLERSVRLPANADGEHIKASYRNGILEVDVPLTTTEPPRRQIPVESTS